MPRLALISRHSRCPPRIPRICLFSRRGIAHDVYRDSRTEVSPSSPASAAPAVTAVTAFLDRHDTENIRIRWKRPPSSCLIVRKPGDPAAAVMLADISKWLAKQHPCIRIYAQREAIAGIQTLPSSITLHEFTPDAQREIDFCITLGGDGTILHLSSLLPGPSPPVVSFSLGTLGFLLPFHVRDYKQAITDLIAGGPCASFLPRMRLACSLSTAPGITQHAMNELNIHRGSSPHLTHIACAIDSTPLTNAVADGLIVSTATGSTAYSLAAGGPILHPSVPGILLTPVCPRSLSFRTVVVPSDSRIRLTVRSASRASHACVTMDGRSLGQLPRGAYADVCISNYPLLCMNRVHEGVDWARDLNELLKWNQGFGGEADMREYVSVDSEDY